MAPSCPGEFWLLRRSPKSILEHIQASSPVLITVQRLGINVCSTMYYSTFTNVCQCSVNNVHQNCKLIDWCCREWWAHGVQGRWTQTHLAYNLTLKIWHFNFVRNTFWTQQKDIYDNVFPQSSGWCCARSLKSNPPWLQSHTWTLGHTLTFGYNLTL